MSVPGHSRKKRVIAATVFTGVLMSAGWVGTVPGASRVPQSLPASLAFQGVEGSATFRLNRHGRTLVILFNSTCGHCANEFDELEAHVDRLQNTRLYLFTTEHALNAQWMSRWPRLRGSDQVTWGVIQPASGTGTSECRLRPRCSCTIETAVCCRAGGGRRSTRCCLTEEHVRRVRRVHQPLLNRGRARSLPSCFRRRVGHPSTSDRNNFNPVDRTESCIC